MIPILTRRQLLRWGIAGGTAVLLPARALLGGRAAHGADGATASGAAAGGGFLTAEEKRVVTAVTARIVPTDELPGALQAGAADYIDALLSFVPAGDANCDGVVTAADVLAIAAQAGPASGASCGGADVDGSGRIDAGDAALVNGLLFDPAEQLRSANVFAGGPFSDRNPFPDPSTGTPSTTFPTNSFLQFLPLTRLQLMSWRVQLLGTAAVPGSDFNVAVLGPVIGLHDRYRAGIQQIQTISRTMFSADFAVLTTTQQDTVLSKIDAGFLGLVRDHTIEGVFSVPEYGGNRNLIGWNLIKYDGDSQPLGYSIFDETTMTYNERPDKPMSGPDPDDDMSGVDATTSRFIQALVRVANPPMHFPR